MTIGGDNEISAGDINTIINKIQAEHTRRGISGAEADVAMNQSISSSKFKGLVSDITSIKNSHCYCQSDGDIEDHDGCGSHSFTQTSVSGDFDENDIIDASNVLKLNTDIDVLDAMCSCDSHESNYCDCETNLWSCPVDTVACNNWSCGTCTNGCTAHAPTFCNHCICNNTCNCTTDFNIYCENMCFPDCQCQSMCTCNTDSCSCTNQCLCNTDCSCVSQCSCNTDCGCNGNCNCNSQCNCNTDNCTCDNECTCDEVCDCEFVD